MSPSALELLLPHLSHADVNAAAGPERQTPLHAIAEMGGTRALGLLLERRAAGELSLDIAATDKQGRSAHALAIECGHDEVARMLEAAAAVGSTVPLT